MKVLITFPRSGSSWIQKYINEYNKKNFQCKDLWDFFGKKDTRSTQEKISFIESQLPQRYSVKYFTYHEPVISGWFNEFYKNDTIIKLNRRDKWRSFLSYICQYETGWTKHNAKSVEDYIFFDNACINLNISEQAMQEWMDRIHTFEYYDKYDEQWFYEDMSSDWLRNKLQVSVRNTISYSDINYEQRINNLKQVEDFYVENYKVRYGNN